MKEKKVTSYWGVISNLCLGIRSLFLCIFAVFFLAALSNKIYAETGQLADGTYPRIAIAEPIDGSTNATAVEVYEKNDGSDELCYRVGTLNEEDGTTEWGNILTLTKGYTPNIAIQQPGEWDNNVYVVVVYHSATWLSNKLYYKVGVLNQEDRTIDWGDATKYDKGTYPNIVFSKAHRDILLQAHNNKDGDVILKLGIINGDNKNIDWLIDEEVYDVSIDIEGVEIANLIDVDRFGTEQFLLLGKDDKSQVDSTLRGQIIALDKSQGEYFFTRYNDSAIDCDESFIGTNLVLAKELTQGDDRNPRCVLFYTTSDGIIMYRSIVATEESSEVILDVANVDYQLDEPKSGVDHAVAGYKTATNEQKVLMLYGNNGGSELYYNTDVVVVF